MSFINDFDPEFPYECEWCGTRFKDESAYGEHWMKCFKDRQAIRDQSKKQKEIKIKCDLLLKDIADYIKDYGPIDPIDLLMDLF